MPELLASMPTPLGEIKASANPDRSYPGIWIEVPGEGDRQLVLVEYDPEQGCFVIQVWDHSRPSDDPVYVQHVPFWPEEPLPHGLNPDCDDPDSDLCTLHNNTPITFSQGDC